MLDHARRTGPAVEAHYQFLAWLVQTVEKFPKSHKFTLGDRIVTTALDVLDALVEDMVGHLNNLLPPRECVMTSFITNF